MDSIGLADPGGQGASARPATIHLGNYRLERLLGRGGMAEVYYGWDEALERPVAVKVIDARLQADRGFARRFIQEGRAVAAWEHPNIPRVYFAGEQEGVYFYAMEYIPGADLDRLIERAKERGERFAPVEIVHIARGVAAALDHAHQHGVIHRDVKPANILIAEDGRVALTDFGLAMDMNVGTLGEVFGTPRYIAPEQARNSAQAVPASDLYALGVVLYQLLTGALPFDDPSPAALAVQHITVEPPRPRDLNPGLSEAVENVLLKALQKNPSDRYQTGRELVAELERAVLEMEASGPPATIPLSDAHPPDQVPGNPGEALARRMAAYQASQTLPLAGNGLPVTSLAPRPQTTASLPPAQPRLPGRNAWLLAGGLALALLICGLAALAVIRLGSRLVSNGNSDSRSTPAVGTLGTPLPNAASETHAAPTSAAGELAKPPESTPAALPGAAGTLASSPGGRLVLFYNPNSLYVLNQTGRDLPVFYLGFERLDKDGKPGRRVDGSYWGKFYGSFRDGFCLVVRRFGAKDVLEPEACQNKQLVVRTPTEEQDQIFWTSREGATEFRVLWREQEVGRCPLDAGTCEVALP